MRVAFVPRSTEIQPLFWRFVLTTQTIILLILPTKSIIEGLRTSWHFLGPSVSYLDLAGKQVTDRQTHWLTLVTVPGPVPLPMMGCSLPCPLSHSEREGEAQSDSVLGWGMDRRCY